jgi:hypothetical protein
VSSHNMPSHGEEVNPFAIIDALSWQELEKLHDDDLSEVRQLSDDDLEKLSSEDYDAMDRRDYERLRRKYGGRDPDELAAERDLDVSGEPAWFQRLWATDLSTLTPAEREWRRRRENKWDRGTVENPNPLPDGICTDEPGDPEHFVSDTARQFWHRRVFAMTRPEFEQAHAKSKDPVVIAYSRFLDEYERRENKRLEKEAAQRRAERKQAQPNPNVGYEALKRRDQRRAQEQEPADPRRIIAEPFVLRPTSEIPPREWLYGRHLIRKFLSTTFAPGAGGKTSLILAEALSMVTGRDLLKVGNMLTTGLRVWIWNGEDPKIEIERRLAAICKHYGITPEELAGRLYVNSGRDTELKIAVQDRNGTRIAKPDVEQIIKQMLERKIDLLVIDPAVSFHSVPENDNTAIDMFAKEWAYIADRTNAAVELAHHVRKGAQGTNEYFVEDGRGAGALLSAARDARVLNFMRPEQALSYGIDGADVFNYFRVDGGKPNMAARSEGRSRWYKIESVDLGNKTQLHDADEVGVVTSYTPTAAADAVPNADLLEIAKRLDAGCHGENVQAKDWAGYVVAEVMNLDPVKDKMRIANLIKTWIRRGDLKVVHEYDEGRRKDRPFVKRGAVPDMGVMTAAVKARMAAETAGKAAKGAADHDPVTGEVFEPEAAPADAAELGPGIPLDMRLNLNALGFTDDQIDGMSAATAHQILSVAK